MKTCTQCGAEKELDRFPTHSLRPGWFGPKCKSCVHDARWPESKKEREQRPKLAAMKLKICAKCKETKPFADFHKMAAAQDGLAFKCRVCCNTDTENWRQKNPGAHAKWYAENAEHKSAYYKNWRSENRLLVAASFAAWAKANPHKVRALRAKRNAAKLRAIPAWANHAAIESVYAEAIRLRRETGERYEVDHIVPLQGKTVSGLHWEGNLQILTEFENISKHNRVWPDMPGSP